MLKEGDSVDFGSSGKRVGVGWTPESAARTAVSLNSSSRIKESSKSEFSEFRVFASFLGFIVKERWFLGPEDSCLAASMHFSAYFWV